MSLEQRVEEWVESIIRERSDLFLVNIRILNNFIVEVLIDGDEGISIDDCAKISRELGQIMDEEEFLENTYKLEVSSPGLNKPLKLLRQYHKNLGRDIRVTTGDGQQIEGKLIDAHEEGIEVTYTIKRKKKKAELKTDFIPFSNVKKTKVLISFK
ncbi:MAG TPA: ribosome assembly cofactor RimP [Sphingobacterium sp.]|nr:ribosome assembly cofactor RimP [Sphingobacterium sp.]